MPSAALAALSCATLLADAAPAAAQSAKLARPVPEWGVNAAIESDLLSSPGKLDTARERKLRVLLVGNSYTRFNLLDMLIERVAESAGGARLQVEVEARPGYSLRMHWKSRSALGKIRSGRFSHVVLQGHSLSAIDRPDELAEDAERFAAAIRAAGSRPVLYETWARKPETALYRKHAQVRTFDEMVARIDAAYSGIARKLQAGLAPVGGAFEAAWRTDPGVPLWGSDGSHPTLAGSYMAACVLYGAITGGDPRDATWAPRGLDRELAAQIRAIAAASVSRVPAYPSPVVPVLTVAAVSGEGDTADHPDKPAVTGNVAASIAAMMGRAPGQAEVPPMAATPQVPTPNAKPASRATTRALPRSDRRPALLSVPVSDVAAQPEQASYHGGEPSSAHGAMSSEPAVLSF